MTNTTKVIGHDNGTAILLVTTPEGVTYKTMAVSLVKAASAPRFRPEPVPVANPTIRYRRERVLV
ncbi:MAG: hypothetical protein WC054_00075 [Candidatus Nanopelagicales bacterium]